MKRVAAAMLFLAGTATPALAAERLPNFVIVFGDDLGYGDLTCFGHPTIKTPHLDRMAEQGQKWTQFYVAAPVCTPSRAGLMTGRYPIRNGMTSGKRVVLFPDSGGGLPPGEVTIAEVLKQKGYATACFGKWHLGHLPQFLPIAQGFDQYFGIPYSNDMDRLAASPKGRAAFWKPKTEYWNVPLMQDAAIVERPADQTTITRRYTDEAIDFIRANKERPFFVYLPHSMPHVPLFRSSDFVNHSRRGLFGDVIEEIDANVGRLLQALRDLKLSERTLVVFSSDNGPWLTFQTHGGSAGLLRAGKGTTFEGGMRVPTIFWWPGTIKAGAAVTEMGSTLDLLATFASLAGVKPPADRVLDSLDLSPVLLGTGPSPRREMFYWTRAQLHAVRCGPWKLHVQVREPINYGKGHKLAKPLLYNLDEDPSEKYDLADRHPEIVARLSKRFEQHRDSIEPVVDQLAIPLAKAP